MQFLVPGAPRLVVDPGVYVSAAISATGAPAQLLETAVQGRSALLVSPLLLGELREVLTREKFQRWISLDDVEAFIQALELLGEAADDPPEHGRAQVCRDPDDDYLVALAEGAEATLLVTGDRDLLVLERPGLDVRSPRSAVEAILHEHPWGTVVIPGETDDAMSQARAEGDDQVLRTVTTLLQLLDHEAAEELLALVITPEAWPAWQADIERVRAMVADRGIATRPEYPSPGVAYVKLPRVPGESVKVTADFVVPAIIVTLQRRPELTDTLGLGGWRIHGIGKYVLPEDLPPVTSPS